jgi:hypothetical protein
LFNTSSGVEQVQVLNEVIKLVEVRAQRNAAGKLYGRINVFVPGHFVGKKALVIVYLPLEQDVVQKALKELEEEEKREKERKAEAKQRQRAAEQKRTEAESKAATPVQPRPVQTPQPQLPTQGLQMPTRKQKESLAEIVFERLRKREEARRRLYESEYDDFILDDGL